MIHVRPPGDKSISHRVLMLAPLARGVSRLRGLSEGRDVRSTLDAMLALGAPYRTAGEADGGLAVVMDGPVALRTPAAPIDCGNSGTTARLLAGLLVGTGVGGTLDGDASLRGRPMRRVAYPLGAMGGRIDYLGDPDRLPLRIAPRATGSLRVLRHRSRVASAQVKSALLLAGLTGRVPVTVQEPARSRDHTERLFAAMGAPIAFDAERTGPGEASFDPAGWDGALKPLDVRVPGDPSAAAFLAGAAILAGRETRIEGVGANPGRIGFLEKLVDMGAEVEREVEAERGGEPVESWTVRAGPGGLRPFDIGGEVIPGLLDEIPLLAVLAARADGRSVLRDAAELRVKESDRLAGLARNLQAIGVRVTEHEDGLEIEGRPGPLSGSVRTRGDHRLAMAFGVLAVAGGGRLEIDDPDCADVSFPGFWDVLRAFGPRDGAPPGRPRDRSGSTLPGAASDTRPGGRVIAIDGPAASGKSTTARAVAERLGFVHVNSGLFYRAITYWALRQGCVDEEEELARRVDEIAIGLVRDGPELTVTVDGARPGDALHGPAVTERVSSVSTLAGVRASVLERLRAAARRHDLVCDGRDIGTTVFPDADLKVYLVADASERARRRLAESESEPTAAALEAERRRLEARDRMDSERDISPLRRARDAVEIDTTGLTPGEVVNRIVELAAERGLRAAPLG